MKSHNRKFLNKKGTAERITVLGVRMSDLDLAVLLAKCFPKRYFTPMSLSVSLSQKRIDL